MDKDPLSGEVEKDPFSSEAFDPLTHPQLTKQSKFPGAEGPAQAATDTIQIFKKSKMSEIFFFFFRFFQKI